MIPKLQDDLMQDLEEVETEPSLTYKMDLERNRIIGYCDDLEAVKQAIYKIIYTERYDYVIYSWDYGIELKELFGESVSYVIPELQIRITEALMADDRIQNVYNFEFNTVKKNMVFVTFSVDTTIGTIDNLEMEVNY